MKFQMLVANFVILACATVVSGFKVLSEKPEALNPCKISDPNFSNCYTDNVQVIFREWKDGVPGLKSVGAIDPLAIKRVTISSDPNSPISFNLDLRGVLIAGLSETSVKEARFDPVKLNIKFQMFVPKIMVTADYSVNGHIVSLSLDGKGKTDISLDNSKINIAMRVKIREEGGYTFTDVDKLRLEIEDVGGMHLQLDNLFNGNKVLEDSANAVFNDNWRSLYEVLRPGLTTAVETVFKDRIAKVFGYVPATYFFEDLNQAVSGGV